MKVGADFDRFCDKITKEIMNNNVIWVIVNRLTKSTHFILFRIDQSMEVLAKKFMQEVVRLHGIPTRIVLDKDTKFRSHSEFDG